MRLADRALIGTPYLVLDVETTGLDVTCDRIVELCAVVVNPDGSHRVLIDTLVRPERAVAATGIHGITDADVVDAPRFAVLADGVRAAMAGRVVAGHNVGFDLRFLSMEFERLGRSAAPPQLCTMRLPAVLDRPARWPLWWACQRAGVPFDGQAHSARGDAVATVGLLRVQLERLAAVGVDTFGALIARAKRMRVDSPWLASLEREPLPTADRLVEVAMLPQRPRAGGEAGAAAVSPRRRYMDAVVRAVAGLSVDESAIAAVEQARARLGLDVESARAVHARILAGARRRYTEDGYLDPDEARNLAALEACLAALESAGQPSAGQPSASEPAT